MPTSIREEILSICQLLVVELEKIAADPENPVDETQFERPGYLLQMCAVINSGMLDDKAGRWLGYVFGRASDRGYLSTTVENSIWMQLSASKAPSHAALEEAYRKIVPELSEKLEALRNDSRMPTAKLNLMLFDLDWIAGKHDGAGPVPLLWASFIIGMIQAILLPFGALDVNEERDRTRPLMHAAYSAMNVEIPASVEVA